MATAFEPLADNADSWVLALERLKSKILDPNLSFYKYCVAATGYNRAPKVFMHEGAGADAVVYDPKPDDCPAVLLETTSALPPEDRGAGVERWSFAVMVYFKAFVRDGDQRKMIRGFHELIRTVFRDWRATGPLDELSNIPGCGYHMISGDLTPEFARPGTGMLIGRAAFALRFTFTEVILG